uniref:Glycosyltransferase family 92 protein n=1 Tax=Meloidogyne hapla TaxID=6305 RepID=A0A1I8AXY9_MELHA
MKIIRYYFEQIFNSFFEYGNFGWTEFNPEFIKLLFEENKTKIPLKFNINKFTIFYLTSINSASKFILNNLNIGGYIMMFDYQHEGEEYYQFILKLINERNKFPKIWFIIKRAPEVFNIILENIETSKDCSKIVTDIRLGFQYFPSGFSINLSEKAENIEKWHEYDYAYTKYQLVNKYNPKMKFSVFIEKNASGGSSEIKRIY